MSRRTATIRPVPPLRASALLEPRKHPVEDRVRHTAEEGTMIDAQGLNTTATPLTVKERRALHHLRRRYREDHGMFSARERAHLHFLRWLVATGKLTS